MALIQELVVENYHWLSQAEFADLVTIAEMTPGPIAVNSATFVGTRVGGTLGAVMATLGCILPSCVIVTLLAGIYIRYRNVKIMQEILGTLRPVVVSMIAAAAVSIVGSVFFSSENVLQVREIVLFIIALIMLRKTKISPILIMLGCGAAELVCRLLLC